jgi:hypothetical protein
MLKQNQKNSLNHNLKANQKNKNKNNLLIILHFRMTKIFSNLEEFKRKFFDFRIQSKKN